MHVTMMTRTCFTPSPDLTASLVPGWQLTFRSVQPRRIASGTTQVYSLPDRENTAATAVQVSLPGIVPISSWPQLPAWDQAGGQIRRRCEAGPGRPDVRAALPHETC